MIKRTFLALAFFAGLLSPALAAGTIPLSLTQRFDKVTTKPLNGGKLYFYAAGTTTPQNAFQDSSLTIPWPNPITLDAGGNVPQLFFADGQIKVRLTNSAGVDQLTADNILVIGASSGGGGGGSVDPTTIIATGDMKVRYGTGLLTGFVRANGRTIGSATSGATERANADTQPLFEYLWGADANLVVSTGRGASANADWVANKTIALPDGRGLALAGLDDMGNSAFGRFTGTTFLNGNATTLGSVLGASRRTLAATNMAALNYTAPVTGTLNGLQYGGSAGNIRIPTLVGGGTGQVPAGSNYLASGSEVTGPVSGSATITTNAGGQAFDAISPYLLVTVYLKL